MAAVAGKAPTTAAILKRQDQAFVACLGMQPDAFDKAWVTFVMKTYPKK